MTTINLGFSSSITWDLEFLVDDMAGWLNKSTVSETSKVGILSSPRFLGLIQPFVEVNIMEQFHRMIYAISLAYTLPTRQTDIT